MEHGDSYDKFYRCFRVNSLYRISIPGTDGLLRFFYQRVQFNRYFYYFCCTMYCAIWLIGHRYHHNQRYTQLGRRKRRSKL